MAKKSIVFILFAVAALALLFSCSKPKVLSKEKVADIYQELYLADQYVKINRDIRSLADTTLIYNAIFEHYGCTLEDYQHSITYYISSDKAWTEILDMAYKKVHKELERLKSLSAHTLNTKEIKIYPEYEFPFTLSEKEQEWLNNRDFWKFNFLGDTIRKFEFEASLDYAKGLMFNRDGLYIGDPGRIVDDSDGSEMFDLDEPKHLEEGAIEWSDEKEGTNPADKVRDQATEARPLTKEEEKQKRIEIQKKREEASRNRQLKKEIEESRKERGYDEAI